MKKDPIALKPQDVLIALKIVTLGQKSWRHQDLSLSLFLSQSEISMGLERLRISALIDSNKKKILVRALLEFLIHGIKYAFPAILGPVSRGIPTAHSAPPVAKNIIQDGHDTLVWPNAEGKLRGQGLSPLYKAVPQVAATDTQMHELLALVDTIRIGRSREVHIAAKELEKRILKYETPEKKQ